MLETNAEAAGLSKEKLWFAGEKVTVKLLGRGMFSTVYRERHGSRRVFAVTHPEAIEKDVLASVHRRLPKNPHLPALEQVARLADGRGVYAMPFYRQPRDWSAVSDSVYDIYREFLRTTWGDIEDKGDDYREPLADVLARYETLRVPPLVREAAVEMVKEAMKHGERLAVELCFENMAFDERGRLVLLDMLYDPVLGSKLAQGGE